MNKKVNINLIKDSILSRFDNRKLGSWVFVGLVLAPFLVCAGFLLLLGKVLHLTYKQISVIVNLYVQGWVLAISSLIPSVACWIRSIQTESWWLIIVGVLLLIGYSSLYWIGLAIMHRHYRGGMDNAFDRCVMDLQDLASRWRISYQGVNLLIFVVWWLGLFAVNITLGCLFLRI